MKILYFLLAFVIILPILGNSSYGISKDGEIVCSDNIEREMQAYNEYRNEVQENVDRIKSQDGEQKAQEFFEAMLVNTEVGRNFQFQKDCLQSLGYDVQSLNPVIVPEFHEMAIIVLGSAIFGIVAISKKFGK